MTREEEIKQAVENNLDVSFYTPQDGELLKETFYIGAKWADENPQSPWISVKDKLPPEGIEVIAFHHKWIDEDFNPNGTRVGFLNGNHEFTSAFWWDYQDCYETINRTNCEQHRDFFRSHLDNTEPEYWCPIPNIKCILK